MNVARVKFAVPLLVVAMATLLPPRAAFAQDPAPTKRVALNFSPGFFTSGKTIVYGAGAEAEWFSPGSVSTRVDVYGYAGQQKDGALRGSYQLMLGLVHNFNRGAALSAFAGFQPGIGFAAADMAAGGISPYKPYPILSPLFGVHRSFAQSFQLTLTLRYVFGELSTADTGAVYLSEVRAGLAVGYTF